MKAMKSFMFGIEATSGAVFAASGAMLLVISAIATLPCAIRAMLVDVRRGMAS